MIASPISSTLIIMVILDILSIVVVTLFYHISNHKFLVEYQNRLMKEYEDAIKQLNDHNKVLTEKLITAAEDQQKTLQSHRHIDKELINTFMKLSASIKENCSNTMSKMGASRIAIYLFHNGTSSSHGIDFLKMSCICEKVLIGSGVRERLMEHSNVPINLFDDMISQLTEAGKYIVINDEASKDLTVHRLFLSSSKVKYSQLVAIFDDNNNVLGFVCAEMMHSYSREKGIEEQAIMENLINEIRPVLSYSDYATLTIEAGLNNKNNVQHD